jgi:23S rRNA (cytidine1920-2'-O)/16S rRNA (cytidine1409-2'-O)-methyltransferase
MKKQRADEMLLANGIASSLEQARALIMSGMALYDEKPINKPGISIPINAKLRLKNTKGHTWVSRGAIKLEHAIKEYSINPEGMVAVDIGASTGGFTDVLLHFGAKCVYAVDVGYGELAWKLQSDPRVIVLDRTNARYLSKEQIPQSPDIIVCDASFISLKTVLPAVMGFAKNGTLLVALIKPQFEVLQYEVGEKGVVCDTSLHDRVCSEIKEWLDKAGGWKVIGITPSPITGPEGNKEFLIYAKFCQL